MIIILYDTMEPTKFLEIMEVAEKLKCNTRHSWTSSGRHESVAEHSWRLALMALLMKDEEEFNDVNIDKVIRMCLIHDLGEAITGDIPTFDKTQEDEDLEDKLLLEWVESFPQPYQQEFKEYYHEMGALQTKEAKLYKALDNLEAIMQHNLADLKTWIPLEYDLQFTYGKDKIEFSDYLKKLRETVDEQTRQKIVEK